MLGEKVHRYIFLLGVATIAACLPLSPYIMSVGLFILVGNWIFEFRYKPKFKILLSRPSIILLLSVFLFHIIWLLNTENFDYAAHDIKIKLPFLALPIIFGTTKPLSKREFQAIIHIFLIAMFIATIYSAYLYIGKSSSGAVDQRHISVIINHIRFALMMNLTCFILLILLTVRGNLMYISRYFYLVLFIWLTFYMFFMGAFSGVVIFLLSFPILLIYWLREQRRYKLRKIAIIFSILLLTFATVYLAYSVHRYRLKPGIEAEGLPKFTPNGNLYIHLLDDMQTENGYRTGLFLCYEELKTEWNKVSKLPYDGKDHKGQILKTTLIRYLTSLNYTKDSVGIAKLKPDDIETIEQGYTNYLFKKKWALYPRLYEIYWELEHYMKNGNPSGHSIIQRLELFKNGVGVVKRFFWLGTGTGDVNDEIMKQYELDKSILDKEWRFRPHNQYLTFSVSFGAVGFLLLILFVAAGIYKEKQNVDLIFIAFLLISLFSMLSEDTLETQAGANFVAFFFFMLLLGRKVGELKNEE